MSLTFLSNFPSVSDNNKSFLGNDQSGNKGQDLEPSNTADNSKHGRRARFTRGERCLFIHLIVTLVLLSLLVIVYVVHLFVVDHHGDNIFINYLRSAPLPKQADYLPVGLVFVVPSSYMCNCLLLSARWSAAPAHCAAARSDPDLVYALPSWRIMYGKTSENVDTEDYIEIQIKRSVVHPHFNRDDFKNNIGLFEHENPLNLLSYPHTSISGTSLSEILNKYEADLKLIGWEDSWHLHAHVVQNPVQPLLLDNCKQYVSSIVELRPYEHCVTLKLRRNVSIIPGAALAMKSNYVGLFSWGESRGRAVPFVILDLAHYKSWIQHILTL